MSELITCPECGKNDMLDIKPDETFDGGTEIDVNFYCESCRCPFIITYKAIIKKEKVVLTNKQNDYYISLVEYINAENPEDRIRALSERNHYAKFLTPQDMVELVKLAQKKYPDKKDKLKDQLDSLIYIYGEEINE